MIIAPANSIICQQNSEKVLGFNFSKKVNSTNIFCALHILLFAYFP